MNQKTFDGSNDAPHGVWEFCLCLGLLRCLIMVGWYGTWKFRRITRVAGCNNRAQLAGESTNCADCSPLLLNTTTWLTRSMQCVAAGAGFWCIIHTIGCTKEECLKSRFKDLDLDRKGVRLLGGGRKIIPQEWASIARLASYCADLGIKRRPAL